ncbi:CHAD domain-containing protein [Streptomyces sp. Amel2xB2]|nr:CHAD domain-containing protein [Streptomyces sp. Amel2xB2]
MPGGPVGTAGLGVPAALERALETAGAAEVLSGYLHTWAADFLRSLRLHEESSGGAQTAPAAAEAVRQLRAAARRIGSALLTYRPLVDAAWADELSGELRRLSGTLAREYRCAARSARLLGGLHRLTLEGVGGDRAAALLERQHSLARSRAHSAALEALVSSRFHAVADAVAVLAYEVPLTPEAARDGDAHDAHDAREVLVPLADRARERLVRAVAALPPPRSRDGQGRDGPRGQETQSRRDAAWLEVRILLRHHRYAQEVLYAGAGAGPGAGAGAADASARTAGTSGTGKPVAPREPQEQAAPPEPVPESPDPRLATAGRALDRYRDAIEAADAAAAAARTPRIAPATAYALGVLHAGQRQEAEAARREFAELWDRVLNGGPGASGYAANSTEANSTEANRGADCREAEPQTL